MQRPLWSFIVLCILAAPAAARDIYVNNRLGNNVADGAAPEATGPGTGPVRDIRRALQICNAGDRIILANTGQPYLESISLSAGRHWGTPNRPLVIFGNGATLDGSQPIPPGAWEHDFGDFFRFRPRYLDFQQLILGDRPAERAEIDPADPEPRLEPLQWALLDGYIYFRPEKDRLPRDYPLRYAKRRTGITLYHVRHVRIENLIVQQFSLDGVNAHDGCADVRLEGVTLRGNGRSGLSIGGASRLVAADCLIGDNRAAQVRTEGYCDARLRDTQLVANTAPAHQVAGGRLYIDGELISPE